MDVPMRHPKRAALRTLLAVAMGGVLLFVGGCATSFVAPIHAYRYFTEPSPEDAWSRKIRGWQARERSVQAPEVSDAGSAGQIDVLGLDLRAKYDAFRADQRRQMARDLAAWVQSEATVHYVADGPVDHWATFEETLARGEEDCDGLELLSFNLLRDLGFQEEEVFRSIVMRPSDGQHHMVTLWFEDPEDPWVIDPTGAMTTGMPRMSELPAWVPIKLFSETRDFTVVGELRTAHR